MAKIGRDVRVLITADHASSRFGGESILPLHIFRGLRRRGVEAWLVVHDRTRPELENLLSTELDRIHFIPDTWVHRLLCRVGGWMPARVSEFTTSMLSHLFTQSRARRIIKRLVVEHAIDVVHQPIPVSPREPSLIYDVGAPVLMGPMNGGMSYPEAFRGRQGRLVSGFLRLARRYGELVHRLAPGKPRAEVLLVANDRTRDALPGCVRGEVRTMIENGVDLSTWRPAPFEPSTGRPTRFIYVGRLIDCKAVDLLLEAFRDLLDALPAHLVVVGDGPLRRRLEARARELGLDRAVRFLGWVSQRDCSGLLRQSDALILPSLHECGGAVVLEAMATALPVIAANWGGPADYIDESCGILVDPASRQAFVTGLSRAMTRLASRPVLRRRMGRAGRERVTREFDWERKIDDLTEIYRGMARSWSPRGRLFLSSSVATGPGPAAHQMCGAS